MWSEVYSPFSFSFRLIRILWIWKRLVYVWNYSRYSEIVKIIIILPHSVLPSLLVLQGSIFTYSFFAFIADFWGYSFIAIAVISITLSPSYLLDIENNITSNLLGKYFMCLRRWTECKFLNHRAQNSKIYTKFKVNALSTSYHKTIHRYAICNLSCCNNQASFWLQSKHLLFCK